MKGTRASIEQFSVVTSSSAAQNGTMNGTVDLIPCSHPASISAENCVEISASNLNISATIKTGRLGKVSFGTLYKRPVAVKQLLMTNEEYLQGKIFFTMMTSILQFRKTFYITYLC